MNDSNNKRGKAPTHLAFHVGEGGADKPFFSRIGCAWANADGKGFNIQLDCVPVDGRITLRIPSEQS